MAIIKGLHVFGNNLYCHIVGKSWPRHATVMQHKNCNYMPLSLAMRMPCSQVMLCATPLVKNALLTHTLPISIRTITIRRESQTSTNTMDNFRIMPNEITLVELECSTRWGGGSSRPNARRPSTYKSHHMSTTCQLEL